MQIYCTHELNGNSKYDLNRFVNSMKDEMLSFSSQSHAKHWAAKFCFFIESLDLLFDAVQIDYILDHITFIDWICVCLFVVLGHSIFTVKKRDQSLVQFTEQSLIGLPVFIFLFWFAENTLRTVFVIRKTFAWADLTFTNLLCRYIIIH